MRERDTYGGVNFVAPGTSCRSDDQYNEIHPFAHPTSTAQSRAWLHHVHLAELDALLPTMVGISDVLGGNMIGVRSVRTSDVGMTRFHDLAGLAIGDRQ